MAVLVVSAVGWLWAAGGLHRGPTAYRAPSAWRDSIHRLSFISHVCTPSQLPSISPLTPTPVKANTSKSPLRGFTSGSCTQIRSFSGPDPAVKRFKPFPSYGTLLCCPFAHRPLGTWQQRRDKMINCGAGPALKG